MKENPFSYFTLSKVKYLCLNDLLKRLLIVTLCCMSSLFAIAQQSINITGSVTDQKGEAIIGASVQVVGQTTGTVTDIDGKFSLTAPSNGQLKVTYLGYVTQTIAINNQKSIFVKLSEGGEDLDELVVIGYGTVKKRDLTGSVTSIKAADITLNPGSNPMQALQGKVPGLDITRTSGQAGEGVDMKLRGTRSLSAETKPLFIIDGLPGDYETLNPNDIESIEVLKDASSTSVYGSEGANGIIIITTKKGSEGKPIINFNSFIGLNGWSSVPKVRIGDSYMNTLREANKAVGNWNSMEDDPKLFGSDAIYQAYLNNKWIDWADEALNNGYESNTSLSISGGTERTKAYASFNFSNEVGQYSNDNYKVYSTKISVDHKINNWINTGVNLQASYTHQNRRGSVKLDRALRAIPLGDVYNEDGSINPYPIEGDKSTISILADEAGGVYKNRLNNTQIYISPYIELTPIKNLSILSRFNGALASSKSGVLQGTGSFNYYQNGWTEASSTNTRTYNYTWENIITYNLNLGDHALTLTGVTSWKHDQNERDYIYGRGITDNKYLWYNLDAATDMKTVDNSYGMIKRMAYVGRVNYSYLGKYLFSASIRRDGDSRLAKGHQWNTFPGLSGAWRINEESFMESTKDWLSNLKLRLSWGISGTANIDKYSSVGFLQQGHIAIGDKPLISYYPSKNISNSRLGWEKSYNTNVGLDMSFLNGRIDVTADFYVTKTKDIIMERTVPVTNGSFDAKTRYIVAENLAQSKNTGFELAINSRNIVTKDFTWSSTFTFSTNKEKITQLDTPTKREIIGPNGNNNMIWRVGDAINSYFNYEILGIWQKGEEADAAVFGQEPGHYRLANNLTKVSDGVFVDAEGNEYTKDNKYAYDQKDMRILGKNSPDWTAGLQNTFTYRDFDLSIYLYMRWGQMINYELLGSYDPSGKFNFPEYFNYWTETNPSNDFPAINANEEFKNYTGYTARPYVNGSFFKIKNITLGYTVPSKLLKKANISKLRVYGTITNPLVYSKSHLIKNYDPEMNGSITYPLTKQLVFGVNLTF